ncbi:MAG: tRNA (guanosine(46)-N7)-methyltransferase TrmB, partial [Alphaproteobacteria bacterium]
MCHRRWGRSTRGLSSRSEIGFGAGEHLAAQAERHPEIGFIGSEVFEDGIVRALGEVARRGLGNVRLFTDDARLLLAALPRQSLSRVFILFPDPWPKRRHHKRRLVAPATLDLLAAAMTDSAELRLATDDRDYLAWMLEHTL